MDERGDNLVQVLPANAVCLGTLGFNQAVYLKVNLSTFPIEYDAGAMLFLEGESCEGLYIVVTGRVRVFKTSAGGREQVLTIEGPGASIAELPVLDGGPLLPKLKQLSRTSPELARLKTHCGSWLIS